MRTKEQLEMLLKQNRRCCLSIFLYSSITITVLSVGFCKPSITSLPPGSHAALHNDTKRVLASAAGLAHSANRGGKRRVRVDTPPAGEPRSLEETFGQMIQPSMSSVTDRSVKHREKPSQTEGGWTFVSPGPPRGDCDTGVVEAVTLGRLSVTGQLEVSSPNVGHQADSADSGHEKIRGQRLVTSDIWQRLQPVVECGDYAMTLTVRRRQFPQLLLDRANESSLPLSQPPPQCGYSVQKSWRDLSLVARYDACHVTRMEESYVLPLLWRETPVKVSCPFSHIHAQAVDPPSVCCSTYGITVQVHGQFTAELLRVNVRGEWTPLIELVELCGYSLERQEADLVIAAPFFTCGITVKNGKYILSLQIGDKKFKLACPVSATEDTTLAPELLVSSPPHSVRGPAEHFPESREPFQWAPPFYLAPLYYPHPTYQFPNLDRHDAYIPPTSSSTTPDLIGPLTLPSVDSEPDNQEYFFQHIPLKESFKHLAVHSSQSSTRDMEDSRQMHPAQQEAPFLGVFERGSLTHSPSINASFPVPLTVPYHTPPSHAFNLYYHYYHHPKIPLPNPPQGPDPISESPPLIDPPNPESPMLPSRAYRSDTVSPFNFDHFFQIEPDHSTYPNTLPTNAPYPVQPHPHNYYFPQFVKDEAQKTLVTSDMVARRNLSDHPNTKSIPHFPHLSDFQNDYNYKTMPDKMTDIIKNSPDWSTYPHFSDGEADDEVKYPELEAVKVSSQHPAFTTLSPSHILPLHPNYFHPSHYYQIFYRPDSLVSDHLSPPSSKAALDPLRKFSSVPLHPTNYRPQSIAPAIDPLHDINNVLHPYDHPKPFVDSQNVHHSGGINSKLEIDTDNSWVVSWADAPGAEYTNMLQSSPFHNLYYHDIISEQQPSIPTGHPDGEASKEKLDNEMEDCTLGQYLAFPMTDSMVEATGALPAHHTEVFEGVGHLPEVHSLQHDSSSIDISPVWSKVECGSPGEVRLRLKDQPIHPPFHSTPTMVNVQLRIARDETFTSFHPEAHLPLSLIQGRPVYMEVSILEPPEPGLVLLVYSCFAYTQSTYSNWMLVYDGCPSWSASQHLPSPHPDHIRRIIVSTFLSLPLESPINLINKGYSHLEDPELYFFCLTEVCSAAGGGCTEGCISSPNSYLGSKK